MNDKIAELSVPYEGPAVAEARGGGGRSNGPFDMKDFRCFLYESMNGYRLVKWRQPLRSPQYGCLGNLSPMYVGQLPL
jgi:hypothetical protein